MDLTFYKGKKVLITGHTGFKGSWMCRTLIQAGAEVDRIFPRAADGSQSVFYGRD